MERHRNGLSFEPLELLAVEKETYPFPVLEIKNRMLLDKIEVASSSSRTYLLIQYNFLLSQIKNMRKT